MKQTKRFAVLGSDARQAAAGRALARAGYTVGGVQQLPQADCILLPLPLEQAGLPLAQLLGAAKPGALALGGKVTDSAISIARAAVTNPQILLLDEITANLDAETERMVLQALKNVSENRTVISISHRTEAKEGRIVPIGKP